jgi:hypothetical protein
LAPPCPCEPCPPKVPRGLPHTRLYLDDLEEIRDLFSELAAKYRPQENPANPEPLIRVGNQETRDIKALPEVGHETTDLTMVLTRSDFALIFRIGSSNPQWWSDGLTSQTSWQTYHQLEEILKRRPLGLLDGFRLSGAGSTSNWVALALSVALGTLAVHFLPVPSHPMPSYLRVGLPIFVLGTLPPILLGLRFFIRKIGPSVLILDYSYKLAARREERRSQIWIATVSATLGLITGVVLDALVRKLLRW